MKSSPRRPWYGHLRVSVRCLLVVVLIAGGGFGSVVRNARIQQRAVAILKQHHNRVWYDHDAPPDRAAQGFGRMVPSWIMDRVGVDYFSNVLDVQLHQFDAESSAALSSLARFQRLESLGAYLQSPTHIDLARLKGLTSLRRLSLDGELAGTQTHDEDLAHLKVMVHLEELDIGSNRITDAGLRHLTRLGSLRRLNIGYTAVTDAGVARLEPLNGLTELSLARLAITDAGVARLHGMSRLQVLNLDQTRVGDDGLRNLRPLINLKELRLNGTAVGDNGLAHLAELEQLEVLIMGGTKITDAGLAHLAGLKHLRVLALSDTKITDAGLVHLKHLVNLRKLHVSQTKVSDSGAAELRRALPKLSVYCREGCVIVPILGGN